jgi:hypothetical protein
MRRMRMTPRNQLVTELTWRMAQWTGSMARHSPNENGGARAGVIVRAITVTRRGAPRRRDIPHHTAIRECRAVSMVARGGCGVQLAFEHTSETALQTNLCLNTFGHRSAVSFVASRARAASRRPPRFVHTRGSSPIIAPREAMYACPSNSDRACCKQGHSGRARA